MCIRDSHLDTRQVYRAGKEIGLSSKEFSLLRYMMQNAGIVLSRDKLEQHVWDYGFSGGSNVIDVYIRYLRKKIDEGYDTKYLHTCLLYTSTRTCPPMSRQRLPMC